MAAEWRGQPASQEQLRQRPRHVARQVHTLDGIGSQHCVSLLAALSCRMRPEFFMLFFSRGRRNACKGPQAGTPAGPWPASDQWPRTHSLLAGERPSVAEGQEGEHREARSAHGLHGGLRQRPAAEEGAHEDRREREQAEGQRGAQHHRHQGLRGVDANHRDLRAVAPLCHEDGHVTLAEDAAEAHPVGRSALALHRPVLPGLLAPRALLPHGGGHLLLAGRHEV
mmetsp:Transcript_25889/g.79573  ORF Transcript_25889/g.79573 Transcript_25889/m.79573 type:complete len:225 (-) Transcript_25889:407-1081(-)